MDALFLPLASAFGATLDQIKLLSCLLIAYPLGALFVRIPSSKPALRHLFSIIVAIVFFFPVFRLYSAFFQFLANILATYIVANYHKGKSMPWVVFVIVIGHITVNNVNRVVDQISGRSYETMEMIGPQMVLTMKMITFGWNVYDGRRKVEDLDEWQAAKRITKYPSLLEFLGYSSVLLRFSFRVLPPHAQAFHVIILIMFYFPGILVGPCIDFPEYMELINETAFQNLQVKAKVRPGRRLPPGRIRAAYTKLFFGLLYLVAFVRYYDKFNYRVALSPEFMKHGLLMRILLFQLGGPMERARYYALWTLTEGASILTGLGFTGFNAKGEPQWDGAANIKIMQFEFAPNFKAILDSWNVKTHIWLRECVYKRVTPRGKKPGFTSSMITFVTSAFWHGVSSGYYLTFIMGGFTTIAARLARSNIRPLLLPPPSNPTASPSHLKRIYDLLGAILSIFILNYAASPFILLSTHESLLTWSRLGWYGHVVVMGSLMFFYGGGTKFFMGLQKAKGILPTSAKVAAGAGGAVAVQNGVSTKHSI